MLKFAAMDIFDSMLVNIEETEDAMVVANVLKDELSYYEVVAERIPKSNLHAAIWGVYSDAANS